MEVSLIIIGALAVVGIALYMHDRYARRKPSQQDEEPEPQPQDQEECCGMHITCERDSLLASVSEQIEYYDDDELDRHAGKDPSQYTDAEIEEFREVLLTLRPDDIAGWARSIQLRGITLPPAVRDELIMIVAEERSARSSNA